MKDKQLSKNFLLSEMLESETAIAYDLHEQFHPPIEIVDNLQCLCVDFLQPVRKMFRYAMNITSGYRCPELNRIIEGSKNSHHMRGMAADVNSVNNAVLFDIVVNNFKFSQCIWYYYDNTIPDFLHLSYDPHNLKCQMLACKLVADKKGAMRRTYIEVDEEFARIQNGEQ